MAIQTPDYLGFVKARPRSPLTTALEKGLETYGQMKKFQTEELTQEQLKQGIKKGQIELDALPGEKERQRQKELQELEKQKKDLEKQRIELASLPGEKQRQKEKEEFELSKGKQMLPLELKEKLEQTKLYTKTGLMHDAQRQEHLINSLVKQAESEREDKFYNSIFGSQDQGTKPSAQPASIGAPGVSGDPGQAPAGSMGVPAQATGSVASAALSAQPGAASSGKPTQDYSEFNPTGTAQGTQNLLDQANLSQQQKKQLQIADYYALKSGKTPPSIELANKINQENNAHKFVYTDEYNKGLGKDMVDASKKSARITETSIDVLNNLNQIEKSVDEATIKGNFARLIGSFAKFDPNFVIALKASARLQLSGVSGLAGQGLGRIMEREIAMIERGTPDPNMQPEAIKEIARQMRIQTKGLIAKNEIFQEYKDMIPDAQRLNTAINHIMLTNNYVDKNGNLHPEAIDDWKKVATKERLMAEAYPAKFEQQYGKDALDKMREISQKEAIPAPKGLSEEEIAFNIQKHGVSRRQVINQYEKMTKK